MSTRLQVHRFMHILDSLGQVVNLRPRCCYPQEYVWLSVCSMHRWGEPGGECPRCNVGAWVRRVDLEADHALYMEDPEAWRRMHNERGL